MESVSISHSQKQSITVPIPDGEEVVELWPERAVFWPATRQLLVADLHWGKDETFRYHGIPIPKGILEADLARLEGLVEKTQAHEVVVLGDLIHAPEGLSSQVIQQIAGWRKKVPVALTLVRGNHDRHCANFPDSWNLNVVVEPMTQGPFAYAHHPDPVTPFFLWAGHLHPTVQLFSAGDRLRLPCFYLGPTVGVLPAFSLFTGGFNMEAQQGDRIFAIAGSEIIKI